jgi:hypothetical protein
VPQNSCWVLEDTNKGGNLDLVILNRGTGFAVGNIGCVQLAEIGKTSKSPITLFGDETVVGVCYGSVLNKRVV